MSELDVAAEMVICERMDIERELCTLQSSVIPKLFAMKARCLSAIEMIEAVLPKDEMDYQI